MKKLILILILSHAVVLGFTQGCVEVDIGEQFGLPNSTTCVDLKVSNFEGIALFAFNIEFDTTTLEYASSITYGNLPGFGSNNIISPHPLHDDVVSLSWFPNPIQAISLPDNTTIASLCFQLKGAMGEQGIIITSDKGIGGGGGSHFTIINPPEDLPLCSYDEGHILIADASFTNSMKIESEGDQYFSNSLEGIIMKSPNGNCHKLLIDDNGRVNTYVVLCPN